MECIFCKQEIMEDSRFCDKCGKMVPRCPTCGKVITRRIRFCGNDGTPIPEEVLSLFAPSEGKAEEIPAHVEAEEVPAAEEIPVAGEVPVQAEAEGTSVREETLATVEKPSLEAEESVENVSEPTENPAEGKIQEESPTAETKLQAPVPPQQAVAPQPQPIVSPQPPVPKKKRGGLVFLIILFILVALAVGAGFGYAAAEGLLPFPVFQADVKDRKDQKDQEEQADQEDGQASLETDPVESKPGEAASGSGEVSQAPEGTQDPGQEAGTASAEVGAASGQEADASGESREGESAEETSDPAPKEADPLTEFIMNCDSRYFTMEELEGLDADMCRIARNGIYARMGRKFNDEALQSYFSQFDWYVPSIEAGDFQESMLNEYQIFNRDLIVEYEKAKGYR